MSAPPRPRPPPAPAAPPAASASRSAYDDSEEEDERYERIIAQYMQTTTASKEPDSTGATEEEEEDDASAPAAAAAASAGVHYPPSASSAYPSLTRDPYTEVRPDHAVQPSVSPRKQYMYRERPQSARAPPPVTAAALAPPPPSAAGGRAGRMASVLSASTAVFSSTREHPQDALAPAISASSTALVESSPPVAGVAPSSSTSVRRPASARPRPPSAASRASASQRARPTSARTRPMSMEADEILASGLIVSVSPHASLVVTPAAPAAPPSAVHSIFSSTAPPTSAAVRAAAVAAHSLASHPLAQTFVLPNAPRSSRVALTSRPGEVGAHGGQHSSATGARSWGKRSTPSVLLELHQAIAHQKTLLHALETDLHTAQVSILKRRRQAARLQASAKLLLRPDRPPRTAAALKGHAPKTDLTKRLAKQTSTMTRPVSGTSSGASTARLSGCSGAGPTTQADIDRVVRENELLTSEIQQIVERTRALHAEELRERSDKDSLHSLRQELISTTRELTGLQATNELALFRQHQLVRDLEEALGQMRHQLALRKKQLMKEADQTNLLRQEQQLRVSEYAHLQQRLDVLVVEEQRVLARETRAERAAREKREDEDAERTARMVEKWIMRPPPASAAAPEEKVASLDEAD